MKKTIQRIGRLIAGKELRVRPDLDCARERFGSAYGGWDLVPAGIDARSVVYSFGVGQDVSFDTALIERFGLVVHAFDPTPKSIAWARGQRLPAAFVLHEYGLAAFDGEIPFHPPKNPANVSHTLLDRPATKAKAVSLPVKRLQTIMGELGHERLDVLKMDIEGAEYAVIDDLEASLIRPRQILVELHHRFPGVALERSSAAIAQLRSMGYRLFSVSATNEEFCFFRTHPEP